METYVEPKSEMAIRNLAQYDDAQRYREWAELMLGKTLTPTEAFLWYVEMGFAVMFAVAWREGQEALNLYYTGLELGHSPSPIEGWQHFVSFLDSLKQ